MKKLLYLSYIIVLSSLFLSACEEEKKPSAENAFSLYCDDWKEYPDGIKKCMDTQSLYSKNYFFDGVIYGSKEELKTSKNYKRDNLVNGTDREQNKLNNYKIKDVDNTNLSRENTIHASYNPFFNNKKYKPRRNRICMVTSYSELPDRDSIE